MSHVAQAGAIAVRGEGADAEVLIVRARKNPNDWIFPKGHIEPGETAAEAAVRELREEAGVVGRAIRPVGVSVFESGHERVEVTYFLVRFVATTTPLESRESRWLPIDRAGAALTFEDTRRLFDVAARSLIAG
jgi:8-oxo-dGTP pyrophosphatase MutT (NUDIX family)